MFEDDSIDSAPGNLSFFLPGYIAGTAALLLSAFFVIPGLFDATLTSRVAIYPLTALIILYGGRKHIPVYAVTGAALLIILPLLGLLWASIPVQGIVPAVRWASFGLMIAGAAGIAKTYGARSIWLSLMTAAIVVAFIEILIPGDLPWGNPNRPGAILATGFVIAVTGAASEKALIRIPAVILIGIALILTSFVTAMIAAGFAVLWYFVNLRQSFHPGYLIGILLAGQIVFTAVPGLTERIAPSLELRCRIWKTGTLQLASNLPLGTGTGQSRLTLLQDAGRRVQILAGDPDKRIDHLHSDILTPLIEWGIAGLLLLFLAGWCIARKRFTPLNGSILLCTWIFLAVDLPLATPLGALPLALCIGVILNSSSSKRSIRIPLVVLIVIFLASLAWGLLLIGGYSLLEKGRIAGLSGARNTGRVSAVLEEATSWIPFEERSWLFLAQAYLDDGMALAAENAAEKFNRIHPGYWRGWILQAQAEIVSGKNAEAACSFLNALRIVPATLPDIYIIALNAATYPPSDSADIVLIGEALNTTWSTAHRGVPTEVSIGWAEKIVCIAGMLPESETDLAAELLIIAADILGKVSIDWQNTTDDIERIMDSIYDQAELIDSATLNASLRRYDHH